MSADRIGEVLETESSVAEPTEAVTDIRRGSEIVFDQVDFHYPGAEAPVLQSVSFRAEPGQDHCGRRVHRRRQDHPGRPRAAAASTSPAASLTIGGVDVRDADLETLWSQIGLVPQRPYLFTRHGGDATCATATRTRPTTSCGRRCASPRPSDFVERMPDELESPIAQGGTNVWAASASASPSPGRW